MTHSSEETAAADRFLVVGLGASAGGIQAFRSFFEHVPADSGLAYVAILHMSPEFDSHLAEVLQACARMPVTAVADRVRLAPDHVYVVSPRQSLTVDDGWLVQVEATSIEERRAPIDIFFRTLAESHGPRAVCVVLSGTGADGSMGLKRVKEHGGICLVQDPGEAEHGDMPRAALATSLVDDVLPASAIPARIIAYRDRIGTISLPDEPHDRRAAEEQALHDIFAHLRTRTGHDFSNYKRATVLRRLERRVGVRQADNLAAYAQYMRQHPDEAQALLKDLLISVTNFFRGGDAFAVLERDVVPKLFEGKGAEEEVRVWVAGCATGEEAYSLAMVLYEHASAVPESPGIQVFATDIDEQAIAFARDGLYTLNDAADVSPERLRRFFVKEGERFRVRKELRELVLFARHNLVKDPPFSRLDLVACRNLLIYLNRGAQHRVLEVLQFALKPGGFLFLGGSESVEGAADLFTTVSKEAHIFGRRSGTPRLGVSLTSLTLPDSTHRRPRAAAAASVPERIAPPDLHQRLLERYAPPSVVVNEEHDIVHVSERAARFLQYGGGEPSNNLVKVVRPELRLELRTALYQAARHRADVEARGLTVRLDGNAPVQVNLIVRPALREDDAARGFFLVLFEETAGDTAPAEQAPARRVSATEPAQHLEDELVRLKAQLRTTVEQYETQNAELRASNEELQAVNEEVRSATEELETSKEELQSVNEELRTVNQELKIKIEEQTQTSNDVLNLINSTDFGTLFLDRDHRIKLFTPRVREIFSLIPTDRGRPLDELTCSLVDVDLHAHITTVLSQLQVVEHEVVTREGRWHLMRIAPYRTAENRVEGVVLSFLDITERKLATEQLRRSEERLRKALEVDTVGVLFFTAEGSIIDANDAFLRMSGFAREDLRNGRLRWDALMLPDRHAQFTRAIEELRHTGRTAPYEVECLRADGHRWWAIFAVTRLGDSEAAAFVVDITDRHRAAEALTEADHRKNEFLAMLAHELRNPLAPMMTALEVLRLSGGSDNPRGERARAVVERQVRHMVRLVDDLLEVSRITLGKIELRRGNVDVADVLRTALEDATAAARASGHQLSVDTGDEPLPVNADAVRLAQVFTNLLNNAAKYTPEGGAISVTARRVDDEAVVTFHDTGVGIHASVLPRVFDLFAQGTELPAGRAKSGLGIGLTLVRTLVEAHGGRVEAESAGPDRGSTFVVRLPLTPATPDPSPPAPSTAIDLSNERLLVVDDNRDGADSLQTLLSLLGADVRVAYDGSAGLAAVAEHQPSLVFLDIGLPDLDGFAVARRIRAMPASRHIVLVALTGWGQPHDRSAALAAGFDYHLTKPATASRLREMLGEIRARK